MGLDVTAISKAKPVACRSSETCDDSHYPVGSYRKRRDGLKTGCYVIGKSGRSFGFRAGSYAEFYLWRRELSRFLFGVEPEEVWEFPRRYRAKPLVELIDFPDGAGPAIGPKTSAKLHDDFVVFASKTRRHFRSSAPAVKPSRSKAGSKKIKKNHINCAGLVDAAALMHAIGGSLLVPDDPNDFEWMWDLYRDFRRAFKLASDKGFVVFH